MRLKQILIAVGLILVLAGAACSSDDDDAAEDGDSSSTVAGDDTGDDSGDDSGDDGSDGGTEAATLPEGWPDDVAFPDGTTLLEATELVGGASWTAVARIDGEAQAAFDDLEAQLTDAGYEIVGSTFTPSDQGGFGSISAEGDEYTVAVAFGPDPTGDTSQVTISVAEVSS